LHRACIDQADPEQEHKTRRFELEEVIMFLGIDVSKSTLDAALLKEDTKPRHKVFSNDAAGHAALIAWLGE